MNPNNASSSPYAAPSADVMRQQGVMTQVYAWMMAGLLSTGAVAMFVANIPALVGLIVGTPLFWVLLIGEVALVWGLSATIHKLSGAVATGLFLFYSLLNGLTLSVIFLAYTNSSIATTFFVTGGTFGLMSAYGYTTRRDLSSIGNLLVMALIGFLLASIVNLFLQSTLIYWITTYVGILIFVGLTAWDTQKIKRMIASTPGNDENVIRRIAIMGALELYLDFINLFLLLLRILGKRR